MTEYTIPKPARATTRAYDLPATFTVIGERTLSTLTPCTLYVVRTPDGATFNDVQRDEFDLIDL